MQIHYKYTRYEPTPAIIAQAQKQVGGLARLAGEGARASLELSQEVGGQEKGDIWRAELTIHTLHAQYRAESIKTEMRNALTTVVRDVKHELSRAREKNTHLLRRGGGAFKNFLRGLGN